LNKRLRRVLKVNGATECVNQENVAIDVIVKISSVVVIQEERILLMKTSKRKRNYQMRRAKRNAQNKGEKLTKKRYLQRK
jgi:hypothetical protein